VAVRTVLWSRLQAPAAQWTGDGWHPSVYQPRMRGKAGRRCIAQIRTGFYRPRRVRVGPGTKLRRIGRVLRAMGTRDTALAELEQVFA
jgi:hypothetical protein